MSWDRLEIRNWQSLKDVDLELGNFTVVVGHTGSGKSALIRSIRALASNVRGSGNISVGASKASVSASIGDTKVTLERGTNSGLYKINQSGTESVFTKLAGQVPDQVTKALSFEPVLTGQSSTNFAGQHDSPFLLEDSGASVARVLGELTNVSKIFDAVREANRRKQNTSSLLNTRKKDLDSLKEQLLAFQGIQGRLNLMALIEEVFAEIEETSAQLDSVSLLLEEFEAAERVMEDFTHYPEVPDLSDLEKANDQLLEFGKLVLDWYNAQCKVEASKVEMEDAELFLNEADALLYDALVRAGTCPLCGK